MASLPVVMFYLFKRLLGYYKSHSQYAILSYAISGFIISITALVTIFFMVPILLSKPEFISSTTPVIFPTFMHGSILDILNYAYYILSVISFLSVWVGTVALLSHYSKKVGKLKFWIAMTLPLAFYLGQIVIISFQIPFPFLESEIAGLVRFSIIESYLLLVLHWGACYLASHFSRLKNSSTQE